MDGWTMWLQCIKSTLLLYFVLVKCNLCFKSVLHFVEISSTVKPQYVLKLNIIQDFHPKSLLDIQSYLLNNFEIQMMFTGDINYND